MRWTDSLTIAAAPRTVWRLTEDVEGWPSFTPTMQRVQRLEPGPLQVGSTARIKQPVQPPAVWTVSALEPERLLTWRTRRAGLTLTASHLLEPVGDGCRNTLVLDLTGPGAALVGALFGPLVKRLLRVENGGFRSAAQGASAQ